MYVTNYVQLLQLIIFLLYRHIIHSQVPNAYGIIIYLCIILRLERCQCECITTKFEGINKMLMKIKYIK